MPTYTYPLKLNAVIYAVNQTRTLTADAAIRARGFTADAFILAGERWTHDIEADHHGALSDLRVRLTAPLGPWPLDTPIHYVLEWLIGLAIEAESAPRVFGTITADAAMLGPGSASSPSIPGTPFGFFWADATLIASVEGSLIARAWLTGGGVITADAILAGRFTADAIIA